MTENITELFEKQRTVLDLPLIVDDISSFLHKLVMQIARRAGYARATGCKVSLVALYRAGQLSCIGSYWALPEVLRISLFSSGRMPCTLLSGF